MIRRDEEDLFRVILGLLVESRRSSGRSKLTMEQVVRTAITLRGIDKTLVGGRKAAIRLD